MPKLPVVSGKKLLKILSKLGYQVVRQKGNKEIAKGTLNDILTKIAIWNNISKVKLIDMLR
ncbi:MAG: type II toxin-antitoxin system HicA family toxin [Candidatus Heimdallarchaeota archaeon]